MPEIDWSLLTAEEVGDAARAGRIAVLPVGATEQHGRTSRPAPTRFSPTEDPRPRAAGPATSSCRRSVRLLARPHRRVAWNAVAQPVDLTALVYDIGRWVYRSGFPPPADRQRARHQRAAVSERDPAVAL